MAKMRITSALLLLASLQAGAAMASAQAMEPLSEGEMEGVTGREGIAISLELRINAKADGEPVDSSECPTIGALSGGTSCRIGLTFADRDGMWIALKSYRGILALNNIRLDASTFGGNSVHRDITSYMGDYDPNNKPAIRLTAGNWARTDGVSPPACETNPTGANCRTYMNQPNYSDFTAALSIDRLSAEFDSGGTPGYLLDNVSGAALSMRVAHGIGLVPDPDNPPDVKIGPYTNSPALIRLDGRLQIHGFGF